MNALLLPFIFLVLFFAGAAAFGLWAYSGMQDYKTNVENKVASAVKSAKQEEDIIKDKQHAEADKIPLRQYVGPEQYGSLHIPYAKDWSGYVVTGSNSGGQPFDGYFQPGVVPNVSDQTSVFALRVQLVNQPYSAVTTQLNQAVTAKTLSAAAYALPKVPSVVGIRYEGEIDASKKISGSLIVLPLRDKTLKIWSESPTYADDLNTHILPNLTFVP